MACCGKSIPLRSTDYYGCACKAWDLCATCHDVQLGMQGDPGGRSARRRNSPGAGSSIRQMFAYTDAGGDDDGEPGRIVMFEPPAPNSKHDPDAPTEESNSQV